MVAIRFGRVTGAGCSQSWGASAAGDHPLARDGADVVGVAEDDDGGELLQTPRPLLLGGDEPVVGSVVNALIRLGAVSDSPLSGAVAAGTGDAVAAADDDGGGGGVGGDTDADDGSHAADYC